MGKPLTTLICPKCKREVEYVLVTRKERLVGGSYVRSQRGWTQWSLTSEVPKHEGCDFEGFPIR